MNKKSTIVSLSIIAISLLIWATSAFFHNAKYFQKNIGDLVFRNTVESTQNLQEIIITQNEKTATLVLEDSLWRVKEHNSYYANYNLLIGLFNSFNTLYLSGQPTTIQDDTSFNIKTFDKSGDILDDISFDDKNVIYDDKNIFSYTGNINIPEETFSWLQQPLLNLEERHVESINCQDKTTSRMSYTDKLINNSGNKDKLFSTIIFLSFSDVLPKEDFDFQTAKLENTIKLTTFEGLVITLNIFSHENEYFVEQKLSTTKLPTKAINDYIEENNFLYEGWIFKISKPAGEVLSEYRI